MNVELLKFGCVLSKFLFKFFVFFLKQITLAFESFYLRDQSLKLSLLFKLFFLEAFGSLIFLDKFFFKLLHSLQGTLRPTIFTSIEERFRSNCPD